MAALREGSYLQAAGELQQAVKLDGRFAAAHAALAEALAELDFTGAADHEMLIAIQQGQSGNLSPSDRKYIDEDSGQPHPRPCRIGTQATGNCCRAA